MIAEAKDLQAKEIKLTDRPKYTKKDLVADHPTWCPGCGDFSPSAERASESTYDATNRA